MGVTGIVVRTAKVMIVARVNRMWMVLVVMTSLVMTSNKASHLEEIRHRFQLFKSDAAV